MLTKVSESEYPITFRQEIAASLGERLKNRHSVVLVGMRRVGISNFLRFFTNHPEVIKTYIDKAQKHLFIMVDLNDLVERELYPFWVLTLKRITDSAENILEPEINKRLQSIFLDAIQSQDLFLLIDGVRRSLLEILKAGFLPTIFFNRFDRIKDVLNVQFFDNLEGLKSACHHKLSYVFTSFRKLSDLTPVFKNASLSLVSDVMYLPLAKDEDLEIVFKNFNTRHNLRLSDEIKDELFKLVGGYIQYLYLAMIVLEQPSFKNIQPQALLGTLLADETIRLQSEELWESLTEAEQQSLKRFVEGESLSDEDREKAKYLFRTGIITMNGKYEEIFSPIFENYLRLKSKNGSEGQINTELSKKELTLFNFLKENLNQVCEREAIIERVWPEEEEVGVSDWAIDRLVSRLRSKLKQQNSQYELVTVKTRGFKLTPA